MNALEPDLEEGMYLAVDMNPRSPSVTFPTYENFFALSTRTGTFGMRVESGGEKVNLDLRSRLKLWVWRKRGETRTQVYAECHPVSGGVEAAPGNWIVYTWWPHVTGEVESRIEKNYLLLIEEMNYRRRKALSVSKD